MVQRLADVFETIRHKEAKAHRGKRKEAIGNSECEW